MNQDAYIPDIDPVLVQRLAADYGLDCDVLAKKLPRIARGVFTIRDLKEAEPDAYEVKRDYIKVMRNSAAVLSDKLSTFPINSTFHAELLHRTSTLYTLKADLSELITALDELDPSSWKEKKGTTAYRNSLILLLAKLWKQQTGKPATSSSKSGHFLAFMCECADIMGVDSSPLPARFNRLRRKNKGTDFEI